jgi:hypothetical protein
MTVPSIDKFPEKLYRDVKSSAAQKGISTKSFLIQALRYALKHDHVVEGKPVVNLEDENRQGPVRRGSPPDATNTPTEDLGNKRKAKGSTKA